MYYILRELFHQKESFTAWIQDFKSRAYVVAWYNRAIVLLPFLGHHLQFVSYYLPFVKYKGDKDCALVFHSTWHIPVI